MELVLTNSGLNSNPEYLYEDNSNISSIREGPDGWKDYIDFETEK